MLTIGGTLPVGIEARLEMRLVCLRLWLPSLYGSYLVFRDGIPIGCASERVLDEIEGKEDRSIGNPALNLILGDDSTSEVTLTRIDPSISTILDDRSAKEFIPVFYRYFGEVFHEGSPFIDSDADFLGVLERYFPKDENARCIDVGSGSGHYAIALSRHVKSVMACDIAIDRLKSLPANVQAVRCDIQLLPFRSLFDFGMCNFALEHVADPYKVIFEMLSVLKKHGSMLLAFPSFSYRNIYGAKVLKEIPTLNFEHLRSFTAEPGIHPWEEETRKSITFLEDHGCEIIEVRGVNITYGLDDTSIKALNIEFDMPEISSTNRAPHNYYGQQTIIVARKIR